MNEKREQIFFRQTGPQSAETYFSCVNSSKVVLVVVVVDIGRSKRPKNTNQVLPGWNNGRTSFRLASSFELRCGLK